MNLKTWYDSGSATVLSGSAIVSGTGALWGTGGTDDNIMVGDLFSVPSQPMVPAIPIAAVTADGELELLWPWPGTNVTVQPYIIRYVGIIERSTRANRMALERMGEISAWYDVIVETDADRLALETVGSPLRAGYRVLVKAEGVIWAKQTSTYGDWIGPVEFKGDKGEKGDTGDGGPTGRGPTPKGTYNPATAYVLDDAVLDNGSTWIALGPTTGNAPPVLPATSNAHWQLLARRGVDGSGTGDMVGPPGAVADRIAVFSGTTGKLLKDGGKTLAEVVPANNSITNAILADMAVNTIKGRVSAGTGDPEDLTATQALAILKTAGAYAKDNIRGTVSQTAGVPTGAVIERASNANGEYVRFADGTQICWRLSTTPILTPNPVGSIFQSPALVGFTFSAPFSVAPRVSPADVFNAGEGDAGTYRGWLHISTVSVTGVTLLALGMQAASGVFPGYVATGRWIN